MLSRPAALLIAALLAPCASAQTPADAPAPDETHRHGDAQDHRHGDPAGGALYGAYGMTREASGTAWQPDSSPMPRLHFGSGPWSFMAHGFVNGFYTDESGPRGDAGGFGTGMIMLVGRRSLSRGALGFRVMLTGEPAMGATGYPLLLQTGETADGVQPLIDRQHPHDMVMELAASWSREIAGGSSVFVYLAAVGEPPIGPPAFMHRASGMGIPVTPISHHFLDATHITHGVATFGFATPGGVKIELGAFNGREADERRWGLTAPRLNSVAGRFTINPHADWSLQWSIAHLDSPEQLHQGLDMLRMTASATYNRPLPRGNWQTTAAWGRNKRESPPLPSASALDTFIAPSGAGHVHFAVAPDGTATRVRPRTIQNALLVESTATVARWHTLYGRVERAQKDELFLPADPRHAVQFTVSRATLGYIFDLPFEGPFRLGLGLSGSVAALPADLEPTYGAAPRGVATFVRLQLGS